MNKFAIFIFQFCIHEVTERRLTKYFTLRAFSPCPSGNRLRRLREYKQKCAERLNEFNRGHLNPYINFHRPCFFSVSVIDRRGKVKKIYPYEEVRTPYEKLKSLPKAEKYLCARVTFETLDAIAYQMSDNEFAERMVKARSDLFRGISRSLKRVIL